MTGSHIKFNWLCQCEWWGASLWDGGVVKSSCFFSTELQWSQTLSLPWCRLLQVLSNWFSVGVICSIVIIEMKPHMSCQHLNPAAPWGISCQHESCGLMSYINLTDRSPGLWKHLLLVWGKKISGLLLLLFFFLVHSVIFTKPRMDLKMMFRLLRYNLDWEVNKNAVCPLEGTVVTQLKLPPAETVWLLSPCLELLSVSCTSDLYLSIGDLTLHRGSCSYSVPFEKSGMCLTSVSVRTWTHTDSQASLTPVQHAMIRRWTHLSVPPFVSINKPVCLMVGNTLVASHLSQEVFPVWQSPLPAQSVTHLVGWAYRCWWWIHKRTHKDVVGKCASTWKKDKHGARNTCILQCLWGVIKQFILDVTGADFSLVSSW